MNSKTHAAVASWITAQQDEHCVSDLGVGRDMHTPPIDAKLMPVQCRSPLMTVAGHQYNTAPTSRADHIHVHTVLTHGNSFCVRALSSTSMKIMAQS